MSNTYENIPSNPPKKVIKKKINQYMMIMIMKTII